MSSENNGGDIESCLRGRLRALLLFDVAEEIDLNRLNNLLGKAPSRREPAFRQPAPEYVRFERPPVLEDLGICAINEGEKLQARIRYFEYGVASVEFQLPFEGSWQTMLRMAPHWVMSPALEGRASALLRERLEPLREVLRKPYEGWVSEDYYVVQLDPIRGKNGQIVTADELVQKHGTEIAQLVRGEEQPLSRSETQEVLQSSMSYYATDLVVPGWVAAFVYDSPAMASPVIELLEYANSQLLEFRYYDDLLTRVLADVYKRLDVSRGLTARWRLASDAERLNTIRLDCQELTERTDNAIKFLSDMFYARVYRLASSRIGVTDYRDLVTEKLNTARDLYDSMVNEFHQARAFLLEVLVIIILIVEIIPLFRGH